MYYLDCVEFYLSHVLTKFLIVGRARCTKKLNTRAMSTIWIGLCEINFRAMSAIWIVLKSQTTMCVQFGTLVLFSTEE